ncbi:MAG: cysteine-rich CWC family protein [Chitinophagaceae bacterium]
MSKSEIKYCPRCLKEFGCSSGNITECQCFGIQLTAEQRTFIQDRYDDCLCSDCLRQLQVDAVLPKKDLLKNMSER